MSEVDVTKVYVGQQDLLKVDKIENHSLLNDSEISKLEEYTIFEDLIISPTIGNNLVMVQALLPSIIKIQII